ncbi:MAG: helix-turn-helix domain-containing protein [Mangrovibacterium sp.]
MENQVIIITSKQQLKETIEDLLNKNEINPISPDFDQDRLSWSQAAKFTNMSLPTLRRRVKEGIFKIHGTGRKIFFLKSELIDALKNKA